MNDIVDRFGLELMLVEIICNSGVEDLVALYQELTGHELTIDAEDEWEEISGATEALTVANKSSLRDSLEFLLEVLMEDDWLPED